MIHYLEYTCTMIVNKSHQFESNQNNSNWLLGKKMSWNDLVNSVITWPLLDLAICWIHHRGTLPPIFGGLGESKKKKRSAPLMSSDKDEHLFDNFLPPEGLHGIVIFWGKNFFVLVFQFLPPFLHLLLRFVRTWGSVVPSYWTLTWERKVSFVLGEKGEKEDKSKRQARKFEEENNRLKKIKKRRGRSTRGEKRKTWRKKETEKSEKKIMMMMKNIENKITDLVSDVEK